LIINSAREKLLGLIISHLEGYLTDSISTKIRIHNDEIIGDIEFNYSWKLYLEYVKKVDFLECGKVKITFGVKVAGKLENARINWKEKTCILNAGRFIALVTISIANVQVELAGIPSVNFPSSKKLCHNQLIVVRDLSLNTKVNKSAVLKFNFIFFLILLWSCFVAIAHTTISFVTKGFNLDNILVLAI
jgi:hypothetical protein